MTKHNIHKAKYSIIISIILTLIVIMVVFLTDITLILNYKIYDILIRCEYLILPKHIISDIVLVGIDNKTLNAMSERWPYSRSRFARVIDNLKKAGAKAIAFDFIFYGASVLEDDVALKKSIEDAGNVIFGAMIDEAGRVHISSDVLGKLRYGIVTKFQSKDGIVRNGLTYMTSSSDKSGGMVSWGLKIMELAKGADLANLSDEGKRLKLSSCCGEEWNIPVDRDTKSYKIHFRAHTKDFNLLSFSDVFKDDFDYRCVKDKIVLVGLTSVVLGDIHNTPIGWIPGLTLNANAALTLYNHDFLETIPMFVNILSTLFGVIVATWALSMLGLRTALFVIGLEMVLYFVISFLLLDCGFVFNYALYAIAGPLCPFLGWKLRDKLETKKYWT